MKTDVQSNYIMVKKKNIQEQHLLSRRTMLCDQDSVIYVIL